MTLTESEARTAARALRVAAQVYLRDAYVMDDESERLAKQFRRQAREARELADRLDGDEVESDTDDGDPDKDNTCPTWARAE
jgi:hypothetical protein